MEREEEKAENCSLRNSSLRRQVVVTNGWVILMGAWDNTMCTMEGRLLLFYHEITAALCVELSSMPWWESLSEAAEGWFLALCNNAHNGHWFYLYFPFKNLHYFILMRIGLIFFFIKSSKATSVGERPIGSIFILANNAFYPSEFIKCLYYSEIWRTNQSYMYRHEV